MKKKLYSYKNSGVNISLGNKFVKHIAALNDYKWSLAAAEARDSKWYSQVGDRAERLCLRLEAL